MAVDRIGASPSKTSVSGIAKGPTDAGSVDEQSKDELKQATNGVKGAQVAQEAKNIVADQDGFEEVSAVNSGAKAGAKPPGQTKFDDDHPSTRAPGREPREREGPDDESNPRVPAYNVVQDIVRTEAARQEAEAARVQEAQTAEAEAARWHAERIEAEAYKAQRIEEELARATYNSAQQS